MPKYTMNEEGQLLDAEGTVIEIDGEPVSVDGAVTKAKMEETVEARLIRERKDSESLKAAAAQMPELQKIADAAAARVKDLEIEVERTKSQAEQESSATIAKYRQEAERSKAEAQQRADELVRYQVQMQIIGAAKDTFNDPAIDLVPHLLNTHKREAVKGEDGKPTGEFKDFYKLRFKNEEGVEVEEHLPVDKALEVWAASHPHHVRATGASGSGGGTYTNFSNLKRSGMSLSEKSAFVSKHGQEAFQKLPE